MSSVNFSHFYKALDLNALKFFPSLKEFSPIDWTYLISPYEIELPKSIYTQAEESIKAFYQLSVNPAYQQALLGPSPETIPFQPRNDSLLMAYDFHTSADGNCFLVEVNTNASGYLISTLLNSTHRSPAYAELTQELKNSFEEEWSHPGFSKNNKVAIVDDQIDQQKMRNEFLMYRDLLASWGWTAEIVEAQELKWSNDQLLTPQQNTAVGFVYNRSTDFDLSEPEHHALNQAYRSGLVCLSPNPFVYHLLANKERLVQWGRADFLAKAGATHEQKLAIEKVLIPTFEKEDFGSPEELWSKRKSLFFKPRRSYGGKSVYRGESVSRKVFERLLQEDILVQKFQPAQPVPIEDNRSVLAQYKFDVRFYVYRDRIQQVVARIYQGQVTNFSSPMGGFTAIKFK